MSTQYGDDPVNYARLYWMIRALQALNDNEIDTETINTWWKRML